MPSRKKRVMHTSTTALSLFPIEKEDIKVQKQSKLHSHASVLMWKSYLQRQRRWRLLAIETFIGAVLFLAAIFIARPVFLTPLQAKPENPQTVTDMLSTLKEDTILGYTPNKEPFTKVMKRAAAVLDIPIVEAASEYSLNMILYNKSRGTPINKPVIWVIWSKTAPKNTWNFSIRSTECARYATCTGWDHVSNPHLSSGFLAIQVAVSQAILEIESTESPNYEISLVAMPVSPLMEEDAVQKALSLILMCFTLAFLPAVLETEALVVWETKNMFKRALRMRDVSYFSMYASWMVYAYLTALPVCMLGAITIILTFRWIHLITALLILISYVTVMTMMALIMAMYQTKPVRACIWTTLFTLLQTYLAELLVHHNYNNLHRGLTFFLHLILPPLGLINAFNEFALLCTASETSVESLMYMVGSWVMLIIFYYVFLLLLQYTVGYGAIGGQVSWSSILFKQAEDTSKLHQVIKLTQHEFERLQEVDEFLAKAISFRHVSKTIMDTLVLKDITFDIYRGEYTILYVDKVEERIFDTLDDLLTGLTLPDEGEIRLQGELMTETSTPLNRLYSMGYCHRSETLVDDLTVQEHFTLFTTICLWHQRTSVINEYGTVRYQHLLSECDLQEVRYTRVRDLDVYYRAQLCWALARLLEPRIIILPYFFDEPTYRAVIKDKIVKFRNKLSVIAFYYSSLHLQHADRIFVFNSQFLVFGGTPAYMFFRYGREYQVRLNLRTTNVDQEKDESDEALLRRAVEAGATVRAHLGSLLILRMPAIPSAPVTEFITDLTDNPGKYGVIPSMINISVPDFEEVVKRAVGERRLGILLSHPQTYDEIERIRSGLKIISEPKAWKRNKSYCNLHFKQIFRKFVQFHWQHKMSLLLTILAALIAGTLLGMALATVLVSVNTTKPNPGKQLSVESLETTTHLMVSADSSSKSAMSIAQAYVMSETKSTEKQVENMFYVALPHTQSFTEYLMTRAIDSPQHYVYVYAYGIAVEDINGVLKIQALYSPLHRDKGAAARSLARVYMALIRHYTGVPDATIQVVDEPLALDLSPWMKDVAEPPLFSQFLLILTISHITLIPSREHGLIRHVQKHASNFSPAMYWFMLYICDVLFICLLIVFIITMMLTVMYCTVPQSLIEIYDLMILPLMILLYGVGCVPQAYVFSLGPQITLNLMTFIIVNMVFGETTIVAKVFYGDTLSYILDFMTLSPQFNMAYAYLKIKQIFIYNTECIIFREKNLCSNNTFHKCCQTCGILQECFKRKEYFTKEGILMEMIAMLTTAVFFTTILLLVEYRVLTLLWKTISRKLYNQDLPTDRRMSGAETEAKNVLEKYRSIKSTYKYSRKSEIKKNTFGEYLCASNVSQRSEGVYLVRDVFLGVGRGEALAISGLKRHGRLALCEILAGYRIPCEGTVCAMSKWHLTRETHFYCQKVSFCCAYQTLPSWMTVKNALVLIATLRGVPERYVHQETDAFINALELSHLRDTRVQDVEQFDITRVHFAVAVVGAPPIIILDEITAWQKHTVIRTMYTILYHLRKRGHAVINGSSDIESQRPVTNRLAFMMDGMIFDVDSIDKLLARYSPRGYTVVVHVKDEVNVDQMFGRYFKDFYVNDISEVLINVQVYDEDLTWKLIFTKMETLQAENYEVYSYIVTSITIDYIISCILAKEKFLHPATGFFSWRWTKKIISSEPKKKPPQSVLDELENFEQSFDITSLKGLPWSVIFHSSNEPPPTQEKRTNISTRNSMR